MQFALWYLGTPGTTVTAVWGSRLPSAGEAASAWGEAAWGEAAWGEAAWGEAAWGEAAWAAGAADSG
jgi:hypothetical protein